LNLQINNDKLEEKFRKTVFERKGTKRGNLSAALKEAISHGIEAEEEKEAAP
jgi:hypothetical protein